MQQKVNTFKKMIQGTVWCQKCQAEVKPTILNAVLKVCPDCGSKL